MWRRAIGVACAALGAGCAAAPGPPPLASPHDGSTAIVLDDHLPEGFRITHVRAALDGDLLFDGAAPAPRASLHRGQVAEGDHTLELQIEVSVPCGLSGAPYEKLTAKLGRSFVVGQAGGLVHVDAFAQSAWLHPADRVRLLVSLRGLVEGRWLSSRGAETKAACGRLDAIPRARCVVQRLVERSRQARDVAGLMCQKGRLEAIDDLIADLDARSVKDGDEAASSRPSAADADLVRRVAQLEREAEYCVGDGMPGSGEPEITSDRRACAAYDETPY